MIPLIIFGSIMGSTLTSPITLRGAAAHHRIDFGTAVTPDYFAEPEYSNILGTEFSVVEPENAMKFEPIHPRPDTDPNPYDWKAADEIVAFAREHHQKVRGHCLVWHNQQPQWVRSGTLTPAQMAEALHNHIRTVMHHFAGAVYAWDVVNEAFEDNGSMRPSVWYNKPGFGFAGKGYAYIEQAFRWAHEADPHAKLFYNDYSAELTNSKSDAIFAMLKDFKSRHVPVDGIGFQCHLWKGFDSAEHLEGFRRNLQRFADLGLDIHVTELDYALPNNSPDSLKEEANLYHDVVQIAASNPRCRLIQIWGFTDKHSWLNSPTRGWGLPWDNQYQKKPAWSAIAEGLEGG